MRWSNTSAFSQFLKVPPAYHAFQFNSLFINYRLCAALFTKHKTKLEQGNVCIIIIFSFCGDLIESSFLRGHESRNIRTHRTEQCIWSITMKLERTVSQFTCCQTNTIFFSLLLCLQILNSMSNGAQCRAV